MSENPFGKAAAKSYHPFFELRGEPGTGKTNLALKFPAPCVIASDGSAVRYCKELGIDVVTTTGFDKVNDEILPFLASGKHSYKTLVIDTATVLWDELQRKWQDYGLKKAQAKAKASQAPVPTEYELTMRDRGFIRSDWAELMRRLVDLPMTKIVTVHLKAEYTNDKQTGWTADAHATLSRYPNVIIQLLSRPGADDKNVYKGRVVKEHRLIEQEGLPVGAFENVYVEVERIYGKYINAKAEVANLGEKRIEVVHHDPEVPTVVIEKPTPPAPKPTPPPAEKPAAPSPSQPPAKAGEKKLATTAQVKELNDLVHKLDMGPDEILKRLSAYGVQTFETLTEALATVIIKRLKDKVK